MASKEHNFNLNTRGSKLTNLTSGDVGTVAPIMFATSAGSVKAAAVSTNTVTGILFPLGRGDVGGQPFNSVTSPNQIGDPQEKNYTLTHSDLFTSAGVQKDGGAQKFINAVLDGAYVAYNSGVSQGSGLSSMTVTRGDLSLTNSTVTGISGAVNTYSRSYNVTFNYTQSGNITAGGLAALPDITNDLVTQTDVGSKPF
ncbi:hypothetical protein CMI37_05145 [Candidatus Pacearchaeota archaeon]|nr:hypothetical protein [Candidatus Pacearchaeota archaeon]|tara:strand:+ start:664 stop:1257 length:594 start_codon:yes stop_codon:yes gene_type:complete